MARICIIVGEGAPDVENLGIYISPVVNALGAEGKPYGGIFREGYAFDWKKFIISLVILLFIVFVVYLFLQHWYKKKYEKHLFPKSNDLYNLVNFIYNSRRSGLRDGKIRGRLREKRWSGEQIGYAFKKIDGKRTGMWEIPLFKFAENRKVKRELEKKQHGKEPFCPFWPN
ncbi:MAG: hypothetical protein IIC79_02725 [Chloroflexi bacterium]|nr:hypothetical protein [Chloroflexota bacterium]